MLSKYLTCLNEELYFEYKVSVKYDFLFTYKNSHFRLKEQRFNVIKT